MDSQPTSMEGTPMRNKALINKALLREQPVLIIIPYSGFICHGGTLHGGWLTGHWDSEAAGKATTVLLPTWNSSTRVTVCVSANSFQCV